MSIQLRVAAQTELIPERDGNGRLLAPHHQYAPSTAAVQI
jgi:hypothetical protein